VRYPRWRVEADRILNSQNEPVAMILPDLSALRRRELIDFIENAERRAYAKGRQDAEEEVHTIAEPYNYCGGYR
jgi:hypothetical protein